MKHRTVHHHQKRNPKLPRGYFIIFVLVFSGIFLTLISSFTGYIVMEMRAQAGKESAQKAFHVAEAGLEYARWFLAQHPEDFTLGTDGANPYEATVPDPDGAVFGEFSLSADVTRWCGVDTGAYIRSSGWSIDDEVRVRTLEAHYTRPTVAEYSRIVDENVWVRSDSTIPGPYHSNGGMRMDGAHNSLVSSSLSSWECTQQFGCSPTQTQNGVFGSGSTPALWRYPASFFDFESISDTLADLHTYALSSGVHLPHSGQYGWYVTFNANGTLSARRVLDVIQVWESPAEGVWREEGRVIIDQENPTTYTIPEGCPVVFVEDDVWVDGMVRGKVTFAAATMSGDGQDRSIILNGNLRPTNQNTDGITLIAENDILVGVSVPNIMRVHGIFVAQNGMFGRNHYCNYDCSSVQGNQSLPDWMGQFVTRNTIHITGTVVSRKPVVTKWTSGGVFLSGFSEEYAIYDKRLADAPPPFTPPTSVNYVFRDFQEIHQ